MKILGSILISLALIAVAGSAWGQGAPIGAIVHCGSACAGYADAASRLVSGLNKVPGYQNTIVTQQGNMGDMNLVLWNGTTINLKDDLVLYKPDGTIKEKINFTPDASGYELEAKIVEAITQEIDKANKDNGKKISVTSGWHWDGIGDKKLNTSYYYAAEAKKPGESTTQQISRERQFELTWNSYNGKGQYATLNGVRVGPGDYTVGPACQLNTYPQGNATKGVRLTESNEGAFKECSMPTAGADASQSGFGNVGNDTNLFGGPGAGPGGPLGANSLLPALLSGLLSQGLGGGGQQGQNQGQPYGNDALSLPLNCAQQAVSPVCGEDGKTYNNSCYLSQQRVTLKSQGVCASPSPSPTPAVNASAIVGQLSQSGIPSSLVDSISNIVASVVSKILSGALTVSETVVR